MAANSAVPDAVSLIDPHDSWTPQERWVWACISTGQIADFNQTDGYGGSLDPKTSDKWPSTRVLRPAFLAAVLFDEPYRSAVKRTGAHIHGAWFIAEIDFSNGVLGHALCLDYSRFEADVHFDKVRTSHFIDLDGCCVLGRLSMDSLRVENSLHLKDGEFADVNLVSARIGSQLTLGRSRFHGRLNLESIHIGDDLLAHQAIFGQLSLIAARVNGAVVLDRARFGPGLTDWPDVPSTRPGLDMNSVRIDQSLLMRDATSSPDTELIFAVAEIGINLDLSGSSLPSIDLTGARVAGELRFSGDGNPVRWHPGALLTLRNTRVRSVRDHHDAWPEQADFTGFTYDSLSGIDDDDRDAAWFETWLRTQRRYSPQPYEHLARILATAGKPSKADHIRYAGLERERTGAAGLRWVWMTALKGLIGYGYRTWFALAWSLGILLLGVLVFMECACPSKQAGRHAWSCAVFYSLDNLLPLPDLRTHDCDVELNGWARYYFYGHKLAGYILVGAVAAAVSGVTKKPRAS